MADKPKLAMYWAASCGGCEIAVLNIGAHILDVDAVFDLAFWPVAADFKYQDVRNYPDGYIDLCLFNGAIRTSENEEIAHLLRQKSKVLVAFGACASTGGIPGLANLTTPQGVFDAVYLHNVSTDNPAGVLPCPEYAAPEGELTIPRFYPTVKSLGQVVAVDYTIPGCPPEPHQIWAVLQVVVAALQTGAALPPRGAVLGAADVAVCKECSLEKGEKHIQRFYRPYEIVPQAGQCLLEQGLLCLGPATRGGCGALCPKVGMGCRGCYGMLDEVEDQGVRFLSAIASVAEVGTPREDEKEIARKAEIVMAALADPAGSFYRFSMANSLLTRARNISGNGDGKGGLE
ncbi:MAG: oxidoreductase [Chloroflexi bacterium]|nr:oxidoreductase [Chloroflexota bacterium]